MEPIERIAVARLTDDARPLSSRLNWNEYRSDVVESRVFRASDLLEIVESLFAVGAAASRYDDRVVVVRRGIGARYHDDDWYFPPCLAT